MLFITDYFIHIKKYNHLKCAFHVDLLVSCISLAKSPIAAWAKKLMWMSFPAVIGNIIEPRWDRTKILLFYLAKYHIVIHCGKKSLQNK